MPDKTDLSAQDKQIANLNDRLNKLQDRFNLLESEFNEKCRFCHFKASNTLLNRKVMLSESRGEQFGDGGIS